MADFAAQVTQTLVAVEDGDEAAASRLLPLVYEELRHRAGDMMRNERPDHTLTPTALVHEAYMKVAARERGFRGRRHFFHAAAQAMRQIIVDHARAKGGPKRGGGRREARRATVDIAAKEMNFDWLALDEALDLLHEKDERRYQVVMLRFFAGRTNEEIAEMLGVDESTVWRAWKTARLWLSAQLGDGEDSAAGAAKRG